MANVLGYSNPPTGVTAGNQSIVNARVLAELAIQFNIGADILGKGNRFVEKFLGAEKMTGDTVMVPIVDSGRVFDKLDLSGEDLSVSRDAVPVTVGPLSTAAAIDQETLTLSIKDPAVIGKRVAKLALRAAEMGYDTLRANALNAQVISANDINNNDGVLARNKIYDAVAISDGSKLDGEIYGVVHPLTWAKLIAIFQGKYGPNDKVGSDLYKNDLGELAGLRWTKTNFLKQITGAALTGTVDFDYGGVFTGADVQAYQAVPSYGRGYVDLSGLTLAGFFPAGTKKGDLSLPFTLADVYSTDIFGNSTGRLAVFHLRAKVDNPTAIADAELAADVFFEGPRQNVYSENYDATTHTLSGATVGQLLATGTSYLAPAIVWKKDDFLVAVKGLEKFYGMDSLTIPTQYRDKGILPLRGLAWTDPVQAATIFRVDVLLGMTAFTRTSIDAIYIAA